MSASPLELPIEPVPRKIVVREELAEVVEVDAHDSRDGQHAKPHQAETTTPWWADVEPVDDSVEDTVDDSVDDAITEPVDRADWVDGIHGEPALTVPVDASAQRDEAGPGTLRPEEPEPTSPVTRIVSPVRDTGTIERREAPTSVISPTRFEGVEDRRHPVRAAFGLVALVAFAALAVAAAIAVAVAVAALALRNAATG